MTATLQRFGLDRSEPLTLHSDDERLTLLHAGRQHSWPLGRLQLHRTSRGVLLCPEPLMFIFVPKRGDYQTENYREFIGRVRSRIAAA